MLLKHLQKSFIFGEDVSETILFPSSHYKARRKRESENAKQMRNTKQNCFSHSSASPRNYKQCSAKQCFAIQTNRCLVDILSLSDLFLDNEHG